MTQLNQPDREIIVIKSTRPRQMATVIIPEPSGYDRMAEFVADYVTASVKDELLTIVTYDHPRKNVVTRVLRNWSGYRLEDHPDETYEHSYSAYKNQSLFGSN